MGFALLALMLGSAAVMAVGIAALLGKLPKNRFAGIRTRRTLASDENWYRAHRGGAPYLIFGGVAALMASLAFLPFAFAGKLADAVVLSVVIGCAVVLVGSALLAWWAGTGALKGTPEQALRG